ncbi:MAG: SusE domain-containing protein, partial [Candidatus Dadabacteria bacterium]
MRAIKNYLLLFTGIAFLLVACDKADVLPYYGNGSAITLSASKTSVTPTAADSTSSVIDFSWTSPNYATDTSTFKYVLEIDSSGRNFSQKTTRITTGKLGTSITGRQLNAILLNYGFKVGTPVSLDVRVTSSYGNNNEQYRSNVLKISVTPFSDPSKLQSSQTSVTTALATTTQTSNVFTWSPAFLEYNGAVTYTLQYDSAGKNFVNPQEMATTAGSNSLSLTQGQMNQMAINSGVVAPNTGKVEYRIKAVTDKGAVSYSNVVNVTIGTHISILRFYLPGSYQAATGNGNDWDPGTAPELIRDLRTGFLNSMYWIYVNLPANAEFKVALDRKWDVNYGGSGGNLVAGGSNFKVTTAGVYRLTIDLNKMKYDLVLSGMATVGDASKAGWDPSKAFPLTQLGFAAVNYFVGIQDMNTGGWKMID